MAELKKSAKEFHLGKVQSIPKNRPDSRSKNSSQILLTISKRKINILSPLP
jgi:hypothetical protein